MSRCEGYEFPCGDPAPFTVRATDDRDEWLACAWCARDAEVFTDAVVEDASGRPRARLRVAS